LLVGPKQAAAVKKTAAALVVSKARAGAAKKVASDKAAATTAASKKTAAATAVSKKAGAAKKAASNKAAAKAGRKLQAPAAARDTYARLRKIHPDAHCELDHRDPFTLLVATVMSAQTTDVLVNKVTPHLFAKYPDASSLGAADVADVARLLMERGMGMYNQKGKNIVGLARLLMERHGGQVPRTLAELVALPGVGRKTANVVLGVAFGMPEGVVVDTHVMRLSQRLGWTRHDDPGPIELDLCAIFPREDWDMLSHTLIFHGRRVCAARRPACAACGVTDACPSAFNADNVGRKAPRLRT
jgi:endonuclease-3